MVASLSYFSLGSLVHVLGARAVWSGGFPSALNKADVYAVLSMLIRWPSLIWFEPTVNTTTTSDWSGTATQPQWRNRLSTLPNEEYGREGPHCPLLLNRGFAVTHLGRVARSYLFKKRISPDLMLRL